jgi:hypothetical protein
MSVASVAWIERLRNPGNGVLEWVEERNPPCPVERMMEFAALYPSTRCAILPVADINPVLHLAECGLRAVLMHRLDRPGISCVV